MREQSIFYFACNQYTNIILLSLSQNVIQNSPFSRKFCQFSLSHFKLTPGPIIQKEAILMNCKFITIEKNLLTKNAFFV